MCLRVSDREGRLEELVSIELGTSELRKVLGVCSTYKAHILDGTDFTSGNSEVY